MKYEASNEENELKAAAATAAASVLALSLFFKWS